MKIHDLNLNIDFIINFIKYIYIIFIFKILLLKFNEKFKELNINKFEINVVVFL